MIVWINGAFGAGKSGTARELVDLIPHSTLYDPETTGDAVRRLLPAKRLAEVEDYQDLPIWRRLVVDTAAALLAEVGGVLIVPMTLLRQEYRDEIFGGLAARRIEVRHILLAPEETILRQRIDTRRSTATPRSTPAYGSGATGTWTRTVPPSTGSPPTRTPSTTPCSPWRRPPGPSPTRSGTGARPPAGSSRRPSRPARPSPPACCSSTSRTASCSSTPPTSPAGSSPAASSSLASPRHGPGCGRWPRRSASRSTPCPGCCSSTGNAPSPQVRRAAPLFDGGTLRPADAERLRLPGAELRDWRFVTEEEAADLLPPVRYQRLRWALRARERGTVLNLEAGAPVG